MNKIPTQKKKQQKQIEKQTQEYLTKQGTIKQIETRFDNKPSARKPALPMELLLQ